MSKKTRLPYQPLGSMVIIKLEPAKDTTKGGIVLPDSVRRPGRGGLSMEPTAIGTVVSTGPGTDKLPIPAGIKAGVKVVYEGGYGEHDSIEHDDEKYHLVSADKILCIVNEE